MAPDEQFLGKGWGFPVAFDHQGRSLRMAEAEEDVRQSLHILLSTDLGERVLRPTFGWKRDALLFEPLSTSFAAYLTQELAAEEYLGGTAQIVGGFVEVA